MTHAPVILLGMIGQLLLPCEGITLRAEPVNDCVDAVPGDSCHKFVTWALEKGLEKHPEWFPSFERSDSDEQNFKQIQEAFRARGKGGCGKPCFTSTSPANAEVLEPPAAEVQKALDTEAQATPAGAPAAAVPSQEAAPAAPAAEEAKPEAAPAALSEEAKAADAPAPAAQEQQPESNFIDKLEADVKALEAMSDSPSLKTLRAEKRQLIKNLKIADKSVGELKARHSQNLQKTNKLWADLKGLEVMENTPASSILRAEKRAQIEKLQAIDKADEKQTTQELKRLHDPEAAAREAAPAAPADAVTPALAQERPQEAEERPPRSDLINKLEAELNAMDQLHISPALETLRAEKRQFISNLQTADKLEAERTERHFQNLQKANKLEADLKALEAMDDTAKLEALRAEKVMLLHNLQAADKSDAEQTTQELQRLQDPATASKGAEPAEPAAIVEPEAAAAGRKPWWQRRWREGKAKAKEEAVKEKQTDDEAQAAPAEAPAVAAEEAKPDAAPAAPAEAPAVAAEEAKPEAVSAAPADEAKPAEAPAPAATERVAPGLGGCVDAVPGDRCHKFVTWALEKGLEKHPDWFPSFERSDSDEQNFKQMQEAVYSKNKAGCGKPCSAELATAPPSEA